MRRVVRRTTRSGAKFLDEPGQRRLPEWYEKLGISGRADLALTALTAAALNRLSPG